MTIAERSDRPLVVLMDTSVLIHQLYGSLGGVLVNQEDISNYVKVQLAWVESGAWLGALGADRPFRLIWAQDCHDKRYWRINWLKQKYITDALPVPNRGKNKGVKPEAINYKGGRRVPTQLFLQVKDILLSHTHSTNRGLHYTGYEADDIIATCSFLNQRLGINNDVLIATVDSDLLGLVGDRTGWMCIVGYKPRLRFDLESINRWRVLKGLPTLIAPGELWSYKALVEGDASDKLPAMPGGETLPAIDLLNPPEEYRLWENWAVVREVETMLKGHYRPMENGDRIRKYLAARAYEPILPKPIDIEELTR